MIREDKEYAALRALQAIVVKGRWMAYKKESHERIAGLLDVAEYLVALIYDSEDMTEDYRGHIKYVSEEFGCMSAIELFDQAKGG